MSSGLKNRTKDYLACQPSKVSIDDGMDVHIHGMGGMNIWEMALNFKIYVQVLVQNMLPSR